MSLEIEFLFEYRSSPVRSLTAFSLKYNSQPFFFGFDSEKVISATCHKNIHQTDRRSVS